MRATFFVKHEVGFIIRILGYGMCTNDRSKTIVPFSIRNGYRKEFRVGKWGIQFFKPDNHAH